MGIDDQTGNFVVFVGNDGFLQELRERNVGERNPRRNHLLGAVGSDPGQPVTGARRRGLGKEIAKVVEDVGGGTYGMPIDHVRSGPSAPYADNRCKAYHLALRPATRRPTAMPEVAGSLSLQAPIRASARERFLHNYLIYLR